MGRRSRPSAAHCRPIGLNVVGSMPLLMHIAFDNSRRLRRRVYYFEYRDVCFKLIQNEPRKWADVLLTIIPKDDSSAQEKVYAAAGQFLSALSWQNSSRVALQNLGGHGVPHSFRLRQARCRSFTFPQVPFSGKVTGYNISPIAAIESEAQRLALALFREAFSCNKVLLSFLLYWQILETDGTDPVGWINKTLNRPTGFHVPTSDIRQLPLGAKKVGEYLLDECRHAIAHIRRWPGSTSLKFDVGAESMRLLISTRVVEQFARHYIKNVLGLRGEMCLVRKKGRGFPVFVDAAYLHHHHCVPAYKA